MKLLDGVYWALYCGTTMYYSTVLREQHPAVPCTLALIKLLNLLSSLAYFKTPLLYSARSAESIDINFMS